MHTENKTKNVKTFKLKQLVFETLEISHNAYLVSRIISILIILLILSNVLAVILSSENVLSEKYANIFDNFELVSVIIFTVEYVLRIWSCTIIERYNHPLWGRIKYMLTPLSIVDLLAVLPFYLPMLIAIDLRFLRALRLFRIFRLFKIARYAKALKTFRVVLLNKKEQLISTLFIISVLIIVSASLLYNVEHEAQPEAFSSIPKAMWWAIITLTTVGYGDIYPITPLGKVMASIILIFSIGMFAVPAGIIASGFTQEELGEVIKEEIKEENREEIICPNCGKKIE